MWSIKVVFIYSAIIMLSFVACKSQQVQRHGLYGEFEGHVKGTNGLPAYIYKLSLNADETFLFEIRVHLGNSGCRGKWKR